LGRKINNRHKAQAGFTLLEILLVIVMIAVTSAMVVPSMFVANISVADESDRLRLVMRLAMEESQLTGMPLRWIGRQHGWSFETLVESPSVDGETVLKEHEWLPFSDPPLEAYQLPEYIKIDQIEQVTDFVFDIEVKDGQAKTDEQPVLGVVLILPDGTVSPSNIYLKEEEQTESTVLEVRPGPSGIRLRAE